MGSCSVGKKAMPLVLSIDHSCGTHIYAIDPKLVRMANLSTNVGTPERVLSLLGGSMLLFDTIRNKRVNLLQTMTGSYLLLRGLTGFCLIYDQLGKKDVGYRPRNVNIRTSMVVNRPRDQVYASWRRLENLPRFMKHLKNVKVIDERFSEWTATVAGDLGTISWKSEILKDDPGYTLSWRSVPESAIHNAGKIRFRDAGQNGTRVDIVFSYHAPMGLVGEKTGHLLNPMFTGMVEEDIKSFREYVEGNLYPAETRS